METFLNAKFSDLVVFVSLLEVSDKSGLVLLQNPADLFGIGLRLLRTVEGTLSDPISENGLYY